MNEIVNQALFTYPDSDNGLNAAKFKGWNRDQVAAGPRSGLL